MPRLKKNDGLTLIFFFKYNKKNMTSFKTEFSNVVSFLIASCTTFGLSMHYFYGDSSYIETTVLMIIFQCSYDIFLYHSHDSAIHHLFVLMVSYICMFDLPPEDFQSVTIPLLATEISTLFLVLRLWMINFDMTKTLLFTVNNAVFAITFAATRWYGFYVYMIANQKIYDIITTYVPRFQSLPIYCGLFGLAAINYYWFLVILKVVFRPLHHVTTIDYDFSSWFHVIHYSCLLYFSIVKSLSHFTDLFFVFVTAFMFLYAYFQSSLLYLIEGLSAIYDSNFVRVPILLDAGLLVLLTDDLITRVNILIVAWVMLLSSLIKPLYVLNNAFQWGLFTTLTVFLLTSQ